MWLIIGGSGFIGLNFADFLFKNKIDFKIYDIKKSSFLNDKYIFIKGDIRDEKKLSDVMKNCDTVFHLATIPPSSKISKDDIYDIDVNGTKNVIKCAEKNNIKRLVFTSSASHVYGVVKENDLPIKENIRTNPINEYGSNKVISEKLIFKSKIQSIILRLSMVFGKYNFDPILLENINVLEKNKTLFVPGEGNNLIQAIDVEDVCNILYKSGITDNKNIGDNKILNVSGEKIISINNLVNNMKKLCNSKSKVIFLQKYIVKPLFYIQWLLKKTKIHPSYINLILSNQTFNINQAKKILNWEPSEKLYKGLKENILFLRKYSNLNK